MSPPPAGQSPDPQAPGRQPRRNRHPRLPRGTNWASDGRHLLAGGPLRPAPLQGRRGLPDRQGHGADRRLSGHRRDHRAGAAQARSTRSIPATASSPRTPTSRRPAKRPGSSSSARRRRCCEQLGDKVAARSAGRRGRRAGAARHREPLSDDGRGAQLAEQVGYPVMLKAAGAAAGAACAWSRDPRSSSRGARAGAPRGAGGLRQRRRLSREVHRAGPAHRGADPRRQARQRRPPLRARLLGAAPPPEGRRDRARRPTSTRQLRKRSATRPCASGAATSATATPAPSSSSWTPTRASSTSSRSTRASRSSTRSPSGHRHRHRAGPDPASPQGAPLGTTRRSASRARRTIARRRLRDPVPRHHRGPGEQLRPRLRPHHRLPLGRRLRHPPRRRHGLFAARSSPRSTTRCW